MLDKFAGKTVLITGACGTIGAELVRQLCDSPAEQIVCLDNNETELFFLLERYRDVGKVTAHLADIRDVEALKLRMRDIDIVLHAAALKHVGLCEDSPNQAIQTNVQGTQNVVDAALANGVERVLFTSSDKAVNPTNVMGTSKLMGERLMTAAAETYGTPVRQRDNQTETIFASTRFGNVLGSRGSVLPLFRLQIEAGGPITLTNQQMTRFIMALKEAAKLVLESVWLIQGGEVMVTKMPIARIEDIALVMRDYLGPRLGPSGKVEIVEIGPKPGEKMYEELMNDEEIRRTWEVGSFFAILSAFTNVKEYPYLEGSRQPDKPYHSAHGTPLSRAELQDYLISNGLLN